MNWLNDIRIRTRLVMLVSLPLMLLLAVGAVGYGTLQHIGVGGRVYNQLSANSGLVADLMPSPLYGAEAMLQSHMLADAGPREAEAIRSALAKSAERFSEVAEQYRANFAAGALKNALMDEVVPTGLALHAAISQKLLPVTQEGGGDAARKIVDEELTPLFVAHRAAVNACVEKLIEDSNRKEVAAGAERRWADVLVLSSIGLALVGTAVLGAVVTRSITRPLGRVSRFVEQLCSAGANLRDRMPGHEHRSELGQLARSFNAFASSLNSMVSEINSAAREVSSNTEEIRQATERSCVAVVAQAESLREITDGVQRLHGETNNVAQQGESVAATANQTRDAAERGGGAVRATIDGMKLIDEVVAAGASDVSELGKKSEEIGRIIQVINDIADQTNLLALNAAIEAARAGEHGRGFAVVADEVRKLAERTTGATKQVAESIRCIQEQTGTAVTRMTEGTKRVREGVELAGKANQALGDIVTRVAATTDLIASISGAMQSNAAVCTQMNDRVGGVKRTAGEVSSSLEASSAAASQLMNSSMSLMGIVGMFVTDKRGDSNPRRVFDVPLPCNLGRLLDLSDNGAGVELSGGTVLQFGDKVKLEFMFGRERQVRNCTVARVGERDGKTVVGLRTVGT